ncbi:MAG: 5-formyltetrahydrofolate cyclo-ligase [Candidatus Diapherotrites archaeon CG10_big_fil_rev_8_21_14_0_10_31_34]|nr:MAG: 5-formyltetrahydrofolate cyclo-ligase [Candidatus Diapherotrites archaeon CG10_big_fil_rev_8_21_14_0_10_31_34]
MKKKQRKEFSNKRDLISLEDRINKSNKIKELFFSLKEVWKAQNIMVYLSFKSEVRTREIILDLLMRKKKVIVPITDFKKTIIHLSELKDFNKELVSNKLGIFQPSKEFVRPFNKKDLDLIVVPGIAFDDKGNRLGFGKGFYDKFLKGVSKKVPVIALAFSDQISKKISSEKHDIPMQKIVTEKEVIECK